MSKKQLVKRCSRMRTICAEDSRISSCVRFPAVSMAKIAEKYEPDRTKAPCAAALKNERHMRIEISDFVMRTFDPRFPRAELLYQTCLPPHLSADLRLCCARNLHGRLGCLNFVWQKAVCVSDAQAPHAGRGYGKKNRKLKRKDLTHTVYKMYNKDSRT